MLPSWLEKIRLPGLRLSPSILTSGWTGLPKWGSTGPLQPWERGGGADGRPRPTARQQLAAFGDVVYHDAPVVHTSKACHWGPGLPAAPPTGLGRHGVGPPPKRSGMVWGVLPEECSLGAAGWSRMHRPRAFRRWHSRFPPGAGPRHCCRNGVAPHLQLPDGPDGRVFLLVFDV